MAKQPYDERLKEVSRATVDAQIWGCGFLMILPDNSFQHIPHDRIVIRPEPKEQPETQTVGQEQK